MQGAQAGEPKLAGTCLPPGSREVRRGQESEGEGLGWPGPHAGAGGGQGQSLHGRKHALGYLPFWARVLKVTLGALANK